MLSVCIDELPGFSQWREASRSCLNQGLRPEQISWCDQQQAQSSLFAEQALASTAADPDTEWRIPAGFIPIAEAACCHNKPERFALLYRVLWRLVHENRHLLQKTTDDDLITLHRLARTVHRDAYKIKAHVRFRQLQLDGEEYFVAWYEPEHYTLERVCGFFTTRFRNMRWSILTPYRAAHWDGKLLSLQDNPDPSLIPEHDQIEDYWLTYYASTFNPARLKTQAMLNQMPRKYWKNLPESQLIDGLIASSTERTIQMLQASSGLDDGDDEMPPEPMDGVNQR